MRKTASDYAAAMGSLKDTGLAQDRQTCARPPPTKTSPQITKLLSEDARNAAARQGWSRAGSESKAVSYSTIPTVRSAV